ncbi:MAG: DUF2975 domain-containing protein [Bacteroidaceae bacterium]|nr:DUF2975 domain-containing protein [Bacteroidaceae bacterium]
MKKKFNLYCGLLIAAIVFGIGLTMFQTSYYMYTGAKSGIELAKQDMETGMKRDPYWALNIVNQMVPVEMMRKNPLEMSGDSIVNLKTGEKMPIQTVVGIVWTKDAGKRMKILQGMGYFNWVFLVVFFVAFIKFVIGVNKGRLFEKSMETQLTWGGWAVFGMYVMSWVTVLINHILNVQTFDFADYNQLIIQTPDTALLYSAFGMLLMGQIFKIGRTMKEEQELTI